MNSQQRGESEKTGGQTSPNGTPPVRGLIRQAALRQFSEVGFHGTGIRPIAEEAGISLATLYHYMGSKEDFLASMMIENIETLLADAREVLTSAMTAVQKVETLVDVHISSHVQRRLLCIVSDTELRSLSKEHRQQVVDLRDEYEDLWKETIRQGNDEGIFTTLDVNIASKALLDMCTGVVHWYGEGGRVSMEELIRIYSAQCLGALSNPQLKTCEKEGLYDQ